MAKTVAPKTEEKIPEEPPFLEGAGEDESKDFRVQDPNYGASNAFIPIEEGLPAVTYYMLKANLAVPIPRAMISSKNKGWDKKKDQPIIIEYANVTDLKDLLDERVGLWTAEVISFQQLSNSLCIVVRISIYATDGVFHSDGTGIESFDHGGFGDPFSNAYAQGFRRACEGHGMGREMWRKSEHVESEADVDNSESASDTQERSQYDPVAKNLADMVTARQLGLIRSISRESNIDANEECKLKFNCSIDELSKRAASDFIDHLTAGANKTQSTVSAPPTHSGEKAYEPQPGDSKATREFMGTSDSVPVSGPPASSKQKDYIRNICSDKDFNEELLSLELFKTNFDEISKSQASQFIEHLIGKKKQ